MKRITKKGGELGGETIIVFAIVFIILIIGGMFIFRSDLDTLLKNLPNFKGAGEEDQIIGTDEEIAICPEGYEIIGRFESGKSPSFLYIQEDKNLKETKIYLHPGTNEIFIKTEGSDTDIGEKIISSTISSTIVLKEFRYYPNVSLTFREKLIKEELGGEEIFKKMILLDKAEVKGDNFVCQKSEVITEVKNNAELAFYGNTKVTMTDFTKDLGDRITFKEVRKFYFFKENYPFISLEPCFNDISSPKKELAIVKEGDYFEIRQYASEKIESISLFRIYPNGLVGINKNSFELEDIYPFDGKNALYIKNNPAYSGWELKDGCFPTYVRHEEFSILPIRIDPKIIEEKINND